MSNITSEINKHTSKLNTHLLDCLSKILHCEAKIINYENKIQENKEVISKLCIQKELPKPDLPKLILPILPIKPKNKIIFIPSKLWLIAIVVSIILTIISVIIDIQIDSNFSHELSEKFAYSTFGIIISCFVYKIIYKQSKKDYDYFMIRYTERMNTYISNKKIAEINYKKQINEIESTYEEQKKNENLRLAEERIKKEYYEEQNAKALNDISDTIKIRTKLYEQIDLKPSYQNIYAETYIYYCVSNGLTRKLEYIDGSTDIGAYNLYEKEKRSIRHIINNNHIAIILNDKLSAIEKGQNELKHVVAEIVSILENQKNDYDI